MYKHFYAVFPYAVSTRKQRERERERGRVNLTNMPINLLLEYETKKRKHWKIIPFLERFPRTIFSNDSRKRNLVRCEPTFRMFYQTG